VPERPKLKKIGEEMRRWCAALEEELSTWPAVTARPMFGMIAFYRGMRIFAAVPRTRAARTETSVLIKLPGVTTDHVKPSSAPGAGWVTFELESEGDVAEALRWLAQAYEKVRKAPTKSTKRRAGAT
jgi:Family of unknown function (DUF5519)